MNPYLNLPNYFGLPDVASEPITDEDLPTDKEIQDSVQKNGKTIIQVMPGYLAELEAFFTRNIVLISIIQTVLILILFIKLSKK